MLLNDSLKQTSEWQLKGKTYKKSNAFYYIGDNINGRTELSFNVNGAVKTIAIPEPLKNLNDIYDEVKNGVAHYSTKVFTVDNTTVLFIEPSWTQTDETVICYCYMPYDVQANTPILCDKLDAIGGTIAKTNDCGVKVINKILALRLPAKLLNLSKESSNDLILKGFNAYLKDNPFSVIYCLSQSTSSLLSDYAFNIKDSNNNIVCSMQNEPSYFNITYPIDVIINTTIDPSEIQSLGQNLKEMKETTHTIQKDLNKKEVLLEEHSESINSLNSKIDAFPTEIEKALVALNAIVEQHNISKQSHLDIRESIAELALNIDFDFGDF